jgi:hypothetical protein
MSKPIRSFLAAVGLLAVAALAAAGYLVVADPTVANAACQISGPSTAIVNQSFTLCGPVASGSTYEWFGPGLASRANYSRCVDIEGMASGGYEFTLVRRVNGVEVERCTRVVNVGSSTGGVESCNISGPESIDEGTTATLCAPQDGLHTYTWTGPNGMTSSSGCINVSEEGVYYLNSRNRLTGSSRTCSHRLVVNGYGGGSSGTCEISGSTTIPEGSTTQLCAPSYANTSYRWTGPGGFVSTSRCINADEGGTYVLAMRNLNTGVTTRCSQVMSMVDQGSNNNCGISGPTTIPAGSSVNLCAPSYANTSYRWTGPDRFVATTRCIVADNGGTYFLTMRNLDTGRTTRCSQVMTVVDQGGGNPDNPLTDSCPRSLQYWRNAVSQARRGTSGELSRAELARLASAIDARSRYLNWSNDVDGLTLALSAGGGNQRKQVERQYAALLANVEAGRFGLTAADGNPIGLDLDTPVNFGGAHTVGELIALTDRLLAGNRGNLARLNSTLNQVNRGIGSNCQYSSGQ